jgi:CelD/BcsL family acetyltransferase involved in cellulose biosynthesis
MIVVRSLRSLDELDAMAERYDAFTARLGADGLYYERAWIRALWPVWGAGGLRLMLLVAERDGRPVGMLPLALEVKGPLRGGLRRIGFLGNVDGSLVNGIADYLIPDAADGPACIRAFHEFLLSENTPAWDVLDLAMLRETSPALEAIRRDFSPAEDGYEPQPSIDIDLSAGYEAWWQALRRKKRDELVRLERRLTEQHAPVAFEATPDCPADRLEQVRQIHQQRQQLLREEGRKRTSLFDDPVEGEAFERLLQWGNGADRSRHYWLMSGSRVVSYFLGFHSGPAYYLLLTAFDASFGAYSPSALLLMRLLRAEADTHGTRTARMLPGENSFKRRYGTTVVRHCRIRIVHPGRPLARLRWGWLRAGQWLRGSLSGS